MIVSNNKIHTSQLKPNFKASLLTQMSQKYSLPQQTVQITYTPVYTQTANGTNHQIGSLLAGMLKRPMVQTTPVAPVAPINTTPATQSNYKNNLRSMFQNNQAVIYAMIPRTFNAKDTDKNGLIENGEEPGYFTNMVERLDELKTYGINTLHWLPINPPGYMSAKGSAGSVYAPLDYLAIDPKLDDPRNPKNVYEEAKDAINECHKRNIRVMVDLPSCMSVDLYEARPDLRATDAENNPKTPEGWEDIRMFNPWKNEDKQELNVALLDYHKKFVDMCIDLGIDGIRADVGRAKPPEFWDELIAYTRQKDPEFAYLAECYTYEDASPMKNMPADRPEDALASGFDSYYGQYHIFNIWKAKDFHKFIKDNLKMSHEHDKGKSLIGSFATHDDNSPMSNGGPEYCMMTNVVQATVPMTNPYIVTGFESGDRYIYKYGKNYVNKTFNQLLESPAYQSTINELLDIISCGKDLDSFANSKNKNKTIEELANIPEYKKIIGLLSKFYLTENKFTDKTKTLGTIQSEINLNSCIAMLKSLAESFKDSLPQLMQDTNARNKKIEELSNTENYKNIIEYLQQNPLTKDSIKYYVHPEHIDIFNEAAKPQGDHPEIGQHFGYLMNVVRPKHGELITKGSYIELPVQNNERDEVIAYARYKDGKALVTIANHDVNSNQKVKISLPGIHAGQNILDIAPKYGKGSTWETKDNMLEINLGPAQAHIFEVNNLNIVKLPQPKDNNELIQNL